MREKRWRSAAKALSWRITGTVDTMIISFIITRRFDFAISIGLVEVVTKMVLYYFHERLWIRLPIGIVKEKIEYQI